MNCEPCLSEHQARSKARGLYESVLYLSGAEIRRCLRCNARRAFLGDREIPLKATDQERSIPFGLIGFGMGILATAALAFYILERFHRI